MTAPDGSGSCPPPPSSEALGQATRRGLLWAVLQSWGNKVFTLLLTIVLARILAPEEFGIAAAALLALMLVPLIAELGFGDSILQRREMGPHDLNLPFLLASGVAALMVATVILLREPIAAWAGLGGQTIYLMAIAGTILISVPTAFQEAMYKRQMRFRDLALRAFAANICGGVAALAAALAGAGVWSFVVQAWVTLVINVVWIWSRPAWLPGLQAEPRALGQMLRIGLPVVAQRLVDFVGTRALDIVIISQIGAVGYGFYILGARLHQTLMQMLQSVFNDVSLTVLSTIADDRARISVVYLRTITLSARLMSPVFVLLAALAPEVCAILFGVGWTGVDAVAQPLLLLGAVQCVQYMNGPFLTARGRPELILVTGVTKSLLQILAVLAIGGPDVAGLTWVYVGAALVATPLSFVMVGHELGLGAVDILSPLLRSALTSGGTFFAVFLARAPVADLISPTLNHPVVMSLVLGLGFVICYLGLMALVDRSGIAQLREQVVRLRVRLRR